MDRSSPSSLTHSQTVARSPVGPPSVTVEMVVPGSPTVHKGVRRHPTIVVPLRSDEVPVNVCLMGDPRYKVHSPLVQVSTYVFAVQRKTRRKGRDILSGEKFSLYLLRDPEPFESLVFQTSLNKFVFFVSRKVVEERQTS